MMSSITAKKRNLAMVQTPEQHQQLNMDLHEVRLAVYLERASIAAYAVLDGKKQGATESALDKARKHREHWVAQADSERAKMVV